jgi:hypothetical protein
MSNHLSIAAIIATAGLVLATPVPAAASTLVSATNATCTLGTKALLTLSHDDGHVEAEIELHAAKSGQSWRIRFFNDGVRVLTLTRNTVAEDGGGTLSSSRLLTDHADGNVITVRVVNQATGERCAVSASV